MELFETFLSEGVISRLSETERDDYVKFFGNTYKDSIEAAKDNLETHPRWSIIAGYYAMHDLAKLFLAKQFSLKVNRRVHLATIVCLKKVLEEKNTKERLLDSLKRAENIFSTNITRYLIKGKREIEKVQYYDFKVDFDKIRDTAFSFLKEIAEPFIKIIGDLMQDD
jgi:hypothetical protein